MWVRSRKKGSGGSGGSGVSLIIQCDADLAGETVTITDGNTTYTETCPSSLPYQIEIPSIAAGSWLISCTKDGASVTDIVTVSDFSGKIIYLPIASSVSYETAYGYAESAITKDKVQYVGTILNQALGSGSAFYFYYSTSTDIANLVYSNMTKNTSTPLNLFDNQIQTTKVNDITTVNFFIDAYVVYTTVNDDKNSIAAFRALGDVFNTMRFKAGEHFDFPGIRSSSFMSIYKIL